MTLHHIKNIFLSLIIGLCIFAPLAAHSVSANFLVDTVGGGILDAKNAAVDAGSDAAKTVMQVPTTYTPLAPLPDVTSENLKLATTVDFKSYVTYAFNLLIALGAVAAVFMITWGGFEYMTTDAVNGKSEGLSKIQNAIYGLLLVLSSYLILKTIDPRFVNIPSTLVTPIENLRREKNSLSDWQQTMNSISAQFQNQADSAIRAKNAAKAVVVDLQKQLEDAQLAVYDACNYGYPEECDAAVTEQDIIQDKLNKAKSNVVITSYATDASIIGNLVNSGGDVINGVNGSSTNTFEQSDADTLQKAITADDIRYQASVKALADDPAGIITMQKLHNVTQAQITIQQQYLLLQENNSIKPEAAIANIQKLQKQIDASFASTVNPDASLKSAVLSLDATAKTYIEKISAEKKVQDAINQGAQDYVPSM
ncbi:MAG: pilin [Candidatus Pacebacteria bacterium]|nr:pilin [Candidatus Paceibacterota bacterium]